MDGYLREDGGDGGGASQFACLSCLFFEGDWTAEWLVTVETSVVSDL